MGAGVQPRRGQSGLAGGRVRPRASRRAMSEINVTPFVDVMLVLLIIFMVAAPMLTVGVPVRLPQTAASAMADEAEEPLTITIDADGALTLQTEPVDRDSLIPILRAVFAERQNDKVFLRADGSVSYEVVMQVMGALNAAGFGNIGLVTDSGGPALDGTSGRTDATGNAN